MVATYYFTLSQIFFFLLGCGLFKTSERADSSTNEETPMSRGNLQQVYVDAPPQTVKISGRKVTIQVSGHLPNPAYKLDHLAVNLRGKVIEVTPLAQHDPEKIVAQMLVPFTDSVEVDVPEAGEYTVRVLGRSQTVETKLKVP
jgi:hypothetical protein